ncbi:MAG: hypothetical protein ABH884_03025 [Candidatus Komeilibacteria bacterium]
MQFYLDFSFFDNAADASFLSIFWTLFTSGGWIFFVYVFMRLMWAQWLSYRQGKYAAKTNFILLAIDVPKDNEQSPKAVEHMMTNLAGAHSPFTKWEEWYEGAHQQSFSLEIVSIDGYIQFLIRTPDYARDMVEAAVYAQYPEAEIVEVEDYVNQIPDHFPDDEWDLWGSELVFVMPEAYPLKTYIDFEHSLSQELKDPMASLLEMFSRIGQGEQMWFQILVQPTDDSWKNAAQKVVNKLAGIAEPPAKLGMFGGIWREFLAWIAEFFNQLLGTEIDLSYGDAVKQGEFSRMLYLTPGTVSTVKLIEKKLSKLGFYCKIRVAYVGRKEAFQKAKRVGTFFSAIKQYNALNANALKPSKPMTTKASYFRAKQRIIKIKNKFIRAYKSRSTWQGMNTYILNIEELATLYHFPAFTVRVPLLKKTEAKKGEPPGTLPLETEIDYQAVKQRDLIKQADRNKKAPTQEYLPDSLKNYDFDNDYYEQKFATEPRAIKTEPQPNNFVDQKGSDNKLPPPNLPIVD